jgi:hypothetical protein
MATKARHDVARMRATPTNGLNGFPTLTPVEFAEFIDSLKEDEAPAEAVGCNDYDPEYND